MAWLYAARTMDLYKYGIGRLYAHLQGIGLQAAYLRVQLPPHRAAAHRRFPVAYLLAASLSVCEMRGMAAALRDGGFRLAILLALGAGAVDAVVIAGFQVLTAAQTGNTILFAVALAQGDWRTGIDSGVSVASFLLGALGGALLLARAGWCVARVLAIEVAVLAGAGILWLVRGPHPGLATDIIGAAAGAMGLQSSVMLHLRASSTTYVTGVLAAFARDLASPRATEPSPARPAFAEGSVWAVYFTGAIVGAWIFGHHGPAALALPLVCLAVAALVAPRSAFAAH